MILEIENIENWLGQERVTFKDSIPYRNIFSFYSFYLVNCFKKKEDIKKLFFYKHLKREKIFENLSYENYLKNLSINDNILEYRDIPNYGFEHYEYYSYKMIF